MSNRYHKLIHPVLPVLPPTGDNHRMHHIIKLAMRNIPFAMFHCSRRRPTRQYWLWVWLAAGSATTAFAAPPLFEDSMAQRTLVCAACHGQQGRAASDGYYPRIAGKPAGYLYSQLLNFRDGRRHYGLMTGLLDPLSDSYLMEMAQYFAALDLPYPPPQPATASAAVLQRGEQLALRGDAAQRLPACVACHGSALTGVAPDVPGLLGLPRDYINAQIGAWRTGQRRAAAPDCMKTITARLSPDDVNAVASWVAAQPLPRNTRPALAAPARPTRPEGAEALRCGSALALHGQANPPAPGPKGVR